jgi:hypothetical protein
MRANVTDLPVTVDMPGFESRQTEWGELNVALEKLAPADYTELFSKLPGGHCSCPHWGYVVSGKVRVKYADHDEILAAGDAYYMAPGHVPVVEEGSVLVEFSPAGEYQKTMAALES